MDEIISRDTIRARARGAFEAGKGRDEHGFNWHSAAVEVWQAEWDKQYAAWAQRSRVCGNELEAA